MYYGIYANSLLKNDSQFTGVPGRCLAVVCTELRIQINTATVLTGQYKKGTVFWSIFKILKMDSLQSKFLESVDKLLIIFSL